MTRIPRGGMTAEEFMAQLAQDEAYQQRKAEHDTKQRAKAAELTRAEQPILRDLQSVGPTLNSVWDLVNTATPYPQALPVLLKHLAQGNYPDRVLEGLARGLAVQPSVIYWEELKRLYLAATGAGQEEGLAVALAACATTDQFEDLVELLSGTDRGDARIHFLGAIRRVGGAKGRAVISALRRDPLFGREARALLKGPRT